MAGEIVHIGTPSDTSLTVTADVIRIQPDSEVVSTGISLSADAGASVVDGLYIGDFPTADAGKYLIRYFRSSTYHSQEVVYWDGSNLIDLEALAARTGYGDAVFYDSGGTSGTGFGVGTRGTPCSSLSDTLTIAERQGINKIIILNSGGTTLNLDVVGYTITAEQAGAAWITLDSSYDYTGTTFLDTILTGDMSGSGTAFAKDCFMFGLLKMDLVCYRCFFSRSNLVGGQATYSIQNGNTFVIDCYSDSAEVTALTSAPEFDLSEMDTESDQLVFLGWRGAINLTGYDTADEPIKFVGGAGLIRIHSDCTAGDLQIVGGDFNITDDSGGSVTITEVSSSQNIADILEDTGTTIPAQITALNDLSAAEVNAEVDAALSDYDAPTKAELDAAVATLTANHETINQNVITASKFRTAKTQL